MHPWKMDLSIYRGDSYKRRCTLSVEEAKTIPADVTGCTVKAEVRSGPGTAVITTLATSVTMPNQINVTLSAAVSATLPAAAKWDLQLTYATSDVTTVVAGAVSVTSDITDSTGAMMMSAEAPRTIRRVV